MPGQADKPMPGWPRGLSAPLAAAYVGLSETTFRAEVAAGRAPAPRAITEGRRIWLRDQLDAYLDRLFDAGQGDRSGGSDPAPKTTLREDIDRWDA